MKVLCVYVLTFYFLISCSKFFPEKHIEVTNNQPSKNQNQLSSNSKTVTAEVAQKEAGIKGVSLLHLLPRIPNQEGAERFFINSFANKTDDKKNAELMKKTPPVDMILEGNHKTDGSHYCFSNDDNPQGVKCARPRFDSEVLSQIKGSQESGSAKQPLYISAVQFMFKSSEKNSSKVVFEGASVEKSSLSFNPRTGDLNPLSEQSKIKISYGSSCQLSDENTVGFDSLSSALNKDFYLTGIWSLARTKRKAFAETQEVQESDRCQDEDTKTDWYCNLFIDKAQVWYSALFPVLYQNPVTGEKGVGHRQFPSQVSTNSGLEGILSSEQSTFGLYSTASDAKGFVKTPEIGKVDSQGNVLKDWEKSFITGLCLKGYRLEKNNSGEQTRIPFIEALRVELRSPSLKVLR
jgi:hypothetical protein